MRRSRFAVGVADHRGDQARELEVDGDAEVHVVVHDERVAVDARVHRRVVAHRVAERADDERQVREREALLRLPPGLVRAADALDPLEVDLDRRVDVRARGLRPDHVLRGAAPDVVERDHLVAVADGTPAPRLRRRRRGGRGRGCGRRAGAAGRRAIDVAPGDPAALAGTGDRGRVEAALGDQAPHDRRRDAADRRRRRLGRRPARPAAVPAGRRAGAGGGGAGELEEAAAAEPEAAAVARVAGRAAAAAAGSAAGGAAGGTAAVAQDREPRTDLDGVALGHDDLGQHAGGRRRDLGVDLVGRHLEQRLVERDRVADLLEPRGDRALGDRLAQLRHRDVHSVRPPGQPCSDRPVSASADSPNSSLSVGCGWISAPRSSAVASQFTAR